MTNSYFIVKTALACAITSLSHTTWAQSQAFDLKQVYEAALAQDSTIRASRATADSEIGRAHV
jgi:hypothetical protein